VVFVEAAAIGFATALLAAVVIVVGPMLSMAIATRRLTRRHRGVLQGTYFVLHPPYLVVVSAAFLIGFGLRLWKG
jgi:hypothetical protein